MTEIMASASTFETMLGVLTDQGWRLDLIRPADDPSEAILSHPERDNDQVVLRRTWAPVDLTAREMELPELQSELVIDTLADDSSWGVGRAGMRYRDLIPSRLGGRFIASHIEVCDGGPINDLVHHHQVQFQMIFCQRGWVEVVYEDQGVPFRLYPGDCVTQPPHIRHKVLASSAGARVVEIGCPAEHDTLFDHEMQLPSDRVDRDRTWQGQRFVRHQAHLAPWVAIPESGFEEQTTEIAAATAGLAQVRVLRPANAAVGATLTDPARASEFHFLFVLTGRADLRIDTVDHAVDEGAAITLPSGTSWSTTTDDPTLQLLEVRLPG